MFCREKWKFGKASWMGGVASRVFGELLLLCSGRMGGWVERTGELPGFGVLLSYL